MQKPFKAILVSTGPGWKERAKHHFLEIIEEHGNSADLILFSGWTFTPQQFAAAKPELIAALTVKARVLWEVGVSSKTADKNADDRKLGKLYSNQDKDLKCHGTQIFTTADDKAGQRQLMDAVTSNDGQDRWVRVGNRRFFWLNCGEVLLLNSPHAEDVAEPRPEVKAWFEGIMAQADGFLNPGHTSFGRSFLTPKHAKYLSGSRRLYLRTVCRLWADKPLEQAVTVYHRRLPKKLETPEQPAGPYLLGAVTLPQDSLRE